MKKTVIILLVLSMLSALFCGCASSQPAAENIGEVISLSAYNDLQKELDSAKDQLEQLEAQVKQLEEENSRQAETISAAEAAEAEKKAGGLAEKDDCVEVWDDENVNIKFMGCELDGDDQEIVFLVENKTAVELTFQSNSIAVDGMSLGLCLGSDSIAAMSTGKVRFDPKEEIENMTPSKITANLKVIDFSKTLWGKQSYEASFVDVEVSK